MRQITIRLLGVFEVTINGVPVTTFAYTKVRALLAYLAVERRRAHTRAELAALLWPDQSEQAARASLSQALTTLRNALGDKGAERPLLLTDSQSVQLDPANAIEVDVAQFLTCVQGADTHTHYSWRTCPSCAERLLRALDFYGGNFLADLPFPDSVMFEEWASLQREHLQQHALGALERLIDRLQWCGDYKVALTYARRLVGLEPLLEVHQRTYMRLLTLNGELTAALAQYKRLRATLEQELGIEPEDETRALFDQIRRGDRADLLPTPPSFAVPMPATPLVNRTRELQTICVQLRDMKVRAVTIIGTGGIGKTRFALEAAHALRHDFEDGVYFVELAALNDATLVAEAIAQALAVKERPRQGIIATLRDHMRAKQLLLILDNFEHVLAAAPLVSELLAACPNLTVLVTSRAVLNIRVEHQFTLEPLTDAGAVQLFLQRAQAAGAVLMADDTNTAVYSTICQRLDRLPLAIELIAVRARTFTSLELLHQLERPLQALVGGPRDVPARHQALRNAIQWSYDLLETQEQHLFISLSVFAGGCTIEAAQAVLGESIEVLPILESLHQGSLLQQQTVAGEKRFVMLETMREFALERLQASGETENIRRCHTQYFLELAEQAESELETAQSATWFAQLEAEHDNLRAALRWALEQAETVIVLRLVGALWRFWHIRGHLSEGQMWLGRVLRTCSSSSGEPEQWAKVLSGAGTLAWVQAEYAKAAHYHEQALALYREIHDSKGTATALNNLAAQCFHLGDNVRTQILFHESLDLHRQLGDQAGVAGALGNLAVVVLDQGDYVRSQALSEEALALSQLIGHTWYIANMTSNLALAILQQGDEKRAMELFKQGLSLFQELGDAAGMTECLEGLALRHVEADPARFAQLFATAEGQRTSIGVPRPSYLRAAYRPYIETAKSQMSDGAWKALWTQGSEMTLDQAVAVALE